MSCEIRVYLNKIERPVDFFQRMFPPHDCESCPEKETGTPRGSPAPGGKARESDGQTGLFGEKIAGINRL
jgi:hypothetical protein